MLCGFLQQEMGGSTSFSSNPQKKHLKLDYGNKTQAIPSSCVSGCPDVYHSCTCMS